MQKNFYLYIGWIPRIINFESEVKNPRNHINYEFRGFSLNNSSKFWKFTEFNLYMKYFSRKSYKNGWIKDQNSTTQYQSNLDLPLRIQEEYFSSSSFNVETIIRFKKYHLHFISYFRTVPDRKFSKQSSRNGPRIRKWGYLIRNF